MNLTPNPSTYSINSLQIPSYEKFYLKSRGNNETWKYTT